MAKRLKVQKAKQRSTKHTYKTKDQVTRTPLNTGGELMCSGRVGSSCSTLSITLTKSVPDERCSINVSCAINKISFLFMDKMLRYINPPFCCTCKVFNNI